MAYWDLVKPIWDKVSIYEGAETFLKQYHASPQAPRVLLAAHWTQSEVLNGGFNQYFSNSTGVLAPEGVAAFRQLGMPRTAAVIERAMAFFGEAYPRDREQREDAMEAAWNAADDEDFDPFGALDEEFFSLVETESGGFEPAADRYAGENGG